MENIKMPKPADLIKSEDGSGYRIWTTDDYFYYISFDDQIIKMFKLSADESKTATFVLPNIQKTTTPFAQSSKTGDYQLETGCFAYEKGQDLTLIITSQNDLMLKYGFAGSQTIYGADHFPKENRTVTLVLPKGKDLYKISRSFSNVGGHHTEWWLLVGDVQQIDNRKNAIKNICLETIGEDTITQEPVKNTIQFGNVKVKVDKTHYFEDGAIHDEIRKAEPKHEDISTETKTLIPHL